MLYICRQATDRLDFMLHVGGQTHHGTFGHATPNSLCFLASHWSSSFWAFVDKLLIRLGELLMDSLGLINFWSHPAEFLLFNGIWLVEEFSRISQQIADLIDLKFGGWTHYGTLRAWLTLGFTPLNFCHFLASDWSHSFCTFLDNPISSSTLKLVYYFIHFHRKCFIDGNISIKLTYLTCVT